MVNNYNAHRSDAVVHVKIHSETAITVASLGVSSGALTTVHCIGADWVQFIRTCIETKQIEAESSRKQ